MSTITRSTLIFSILIVAVLSLGYIEGLDQGFTGAPSEVACAPCHHDPALDMTGGANLTGLPSHVVGGQTYPMQVTLYTDNSIAKTAGFQMTVLNADGTSHGAFTESDPNVGIRQFGNRQYVQHDPALEFNIELGILSVTFDYAWTPEMVGQVTPVSGYMSAVLGNGNLVGTAGGQRGDSVISLMQAVTVVPQLTGSITVLLTPLCAGDENGALQVNYSGGMAPFNVQWSNGANTNTVFDLGAGNYSVTVTDAIGQQLMFSEQLMDPLPVEAEGAVMHPSCDDTADGSVFVTAEGGSGPYEFHWSNGSTANPITGLDDGEATVTVLDAFGCNTILQFSLVSPDPVGIELIDVQPQTQNTGGAVIIQLSGGTPPYDFFWEGPDDFTTTIQNPFDLEAGTYNLTVTDANGCEEYLTVEIEFASALDDIAARNRLLVLSPIPATTILNLKTPEDVGTAWSVRIIDTKGTLMMDREISITGDKWSFRIPEHWIPGVYLLMAESKHTGDIYTQRWVKISE